MHYIRFHTYRVRRIQGEFNFLPVGGVIIFGIHTYSTLPFYLQLYSTQVELATRIFPFHPFLTTLSSTAYAFLSNHHSLHFYTHYPISLYSYFIPIFSTISLSKCFFSTCPNSLDLFSFIFLVMSALLLNSLLFISNSNQPGHTAP